MKRNAPAFAVAVLAASIIVAAPVLRADPAVRPYTT